MVSMIKRATDCSIIVGQNGIAWISGQPEMEVITVNAIQMIEEHSHISGLTDKVQEYLEKATGRKIEMTAEAAEIGEDVSNANEEMRE
jgi:exosome complex component RRP4